MLWILGVIQTVMLLAIAGALGIIFSVLQRLTKVETIIELLGVNAAKALHCPTTPQLDKILEKYYERNFEISMEEWQTLLDFYQKVLDDMGQPRSYRLAAGQLVAVCHHKLKHDPPINRKIP